MIIRTDAENRKEVVKAVEQAAGVKLKYLGPPTFSYTTEGITVDREGNVDAQIKTCEIRGELERRALLEDTVSITVPTEGFTLAGYISFVNLVYSKQKLLNASIGAEGFHVSDEVILNIKENNPQDVSYIRDLLSREGECGGFVIEDEGIRFTGFEYGEGEELVAYCTVAAMMVAHAREHSRTHAKLTTSENEKYAMRIWLNQLGLSGKGGKDTRAVMMKRLSGSAAFRTDESRKKWEEKRCSE